VLYSIGFSLFSFLRSNENKQDEMICVLDKFMEYVPSHTSEDHINGPDNGETVDLKSHEFHRIMYVAGTS